MLRYIELKTGYHDDGPAWIAREYLELVGEEELDHRRFVVSDAIVPPDPSRFHALENES